MKAVITRADISGLERKEKKRREGEERRGSKLKAGLTNAKFNVKPEPDPWYVERLSICCLREDFREESSPC